MKSNELRKFLRLLRMSWDVSQSDVASAVGSSTSFYASVEQGSKSMPPEMCNRLCGYFSLNSADKKELIRLSAESCKQIRIDMKNRSQFQKITLFKTAMDSV